MVDSWFHIRILLIFHCDCVSFLYIVSYTWSSTHPLPGAVLGKIISKTIWNQNQNNISKNDLKSKSKSFFQLISNQNHSYNDLQNQNH